MATTFYTAASLDGFLADEHHSLDWLFQFPQEGEPDYLQFIKRVGALCMGSHTYEWLWRHHIAPDAPQPMAWPYEQPTWVFSTRALPRVEQADIRFVSGDITPVHEAMVRAAGGHDVWVVGGGDLVGQLFDVGLLDEIIVTIASVTLGRGMPLLPRRIVTPPLELQSVRQMGRGFAQLHYTVPRVSSPSGRAAASDRP
jgi:dihydrofolate reductase